MPPPIKILTKGARGSSGVAPVPMDNPLPIDLLEYYERLRKRGTPPCCLGKDQYLEPVHTSNNPDQKTFFNKVLDSDYHKSIYCKNDNHK